MTDLILDTLLDGAKMLPFLFAAYLLMEWFEHRSSEKMELALRRTGRFGPIVGAVLGIFPQCGFSVAAANFYAGRVITMGTLVAVFVSTSDEAIPVLLAHPGSAHEIFAIVGAKLAVALVAGFATDLLLGGRRSLEPAEVRREHEEHTAECGGEHGILLNLTIHFIGEQNLGRLLMQNSIFAPAVAALIGFIPNCAASVVLTELYLSGAIGFGSIIAGLSTGAGVGLLMLFKSNRSLRENFKVMAILFVFATAAGMLLTGVL